MAHTCEARWDFAYGGHLTGGPTLEPRQITRKLSDGRAFGRAVAAWHAYRRDHDHTLFGFWTPSEARMTAYEAMFASYAADAAAAAAAGMPITAEQLVDRERWMGQILNHHMDTMPRFENFTLIEHEIDVPIPSRTGQQASTVYRLHGFLDGFTIPAAGGHMVVEFKLRDELTPVDVIQNDRQIRDYAWGYQQMTGVRVVGAYVLERLNKPPKPAKLVKAKSKKDPQDEQGLTPSHDKDQLCTPEAYVALCRKYGVETRQHVVEALQARQWQQLVPVMFRPSQLEEVGRELVSTAQKLRDLDSGARRPVRNTQPYLCKRCRFRRACPTPQDTAFLEMHYRFGTPKRLKASLGGPSHTPASEPGTTDTPALVAPAATGTSEAVAAAYREM